MSQPTKRNAEDAAIEHHTERRAKRPRRKSQKPDLSNGRPLHGPVAIGNNQQDKAEGLTLTAPSKTTIEESVAGKDEGSHTKVKHLTPKSGTIVQDTQSSSSRSKTALPTTSSDDTDQKIQVPNQAETFGDLQVAKSSTREIALHVQGHDKTIAVKSKHKKPGRRGPERDNSWKISERIGGTFLNIDPILTPDNQHLILVTKHDIQIYSTATSLLMRSISGDEHSEFRTCTLSTSDPRHIFVGARSGSITKFDWTVGRRLCHWKTKSGVIKISFAGTYPEHEDLLAVRTHQSGTASLVRFSIASKGSQVSTKVLLESDFLHSSIHFSHDLSIIVACSKNHINVGYASKPGASEQMRYLWETVLCKGRIVSFDTRISEGQSRKTNLSRVDVAVGLQNGAIMMYSDILSTLFGRQGADTRTHESRQRLHWHRTAVQSVKWSRDGNYLISGGNESVLVIWQLDTNQKQFLPHLSTSILNIAVSESGAHYALRLGDNSVMVLSTADLVPSSNITGFLASGDDAGTIMLHPSSPNKLLSAVSARALGSRATGEITHLQVYDINAKMQLGRQALTRNFTTAVNVDPNGQALHEPSITHICTSTNGDWLATVDEWVPLRTDLSSLYLEDESSLSPQETTLRFWAWKSDENSWRPNTRVESPHSSGVSVVAMASNPVKSEVATLGVDGCLKMWTPKIRVRNGLPIKDEEGQALHTWSCSRTVQITGVSDASVPVPDGAVTYSEDGSVVAACWTTDSPNSLVHLIDSASGTVVLSQLGLVGRGQVRLQFCGRYLLALTDVLTMFDIILLQTMSCITLDTKFTSSEHVSTRKMTVNALTKTVAIGVAFQEKQQQQQSHISIFDLQGSGLALRFEATLSGHIRALLADSQAEGFIIADGDATVRKLIPPGRVSSESLDLIHLSSADVRTQAMRRGVDDVFKGPIKNDIAGTKDQFLLKNQTEDGVSSLDALFGASGDSNSLLNVHDLFDRVAKAVSGVHVTA